MISVSNPASIESVIQNKTKTQQLQRRYDGFVDRVNQIQLEYSNNSLLFTNISNPSFIWSQYGHSIQESVSIGDLTKIVSEEYGLPEKTAEIELQIGLEAGVLSCPSESERDLSNPKLVELDDVDIQLANPIDHPYLYINPSYYDKFCEYTTWIEIFQQDYLTHAHTIELKHFEDYLTGVYPYFQMSNTSNGSISPVEKNGITMSAVAIGQQAGVIGTIERDNITKIAFTKDPVLYLYQKWDDIASDDGRLTKEEIDTLLDNWLGGRGGRPYRKILEIKGYLISIDNTNKYELLEYDDRAGRYVPIRDIRPLLTYDEPTNQPATHDLDAEAVSQFIDTCVKPDTDQQSTGVNKSEFMSVFDRWCKINNVELNDLGFDRAKNMRKGEMGSILLDNHDIEKAQIRIDDERQRVYRPAELTKEAKALLTRDENSE